MKKGARRCEGVQGGAGGARVCVGGGGLSAYHRWIRTLPEASTVISRSSCGTWLGLGLGLGLRLGPGLGFGFG